MSATLNRLRYNLLDRMKCHPSLYLPFARRFKRAKFDQADRTVSPDTELVIEAFPRSSNTFAVAAFLHAQQREVKLAHHLHAPAQVMAAAKWNVPALVIIRHPEACVLSMMVRNAMFTPAQLFQSYARFHHAIEPFRSSFVLAKFETVTADFGEVIDAVNAKFDASFRRFDHTPDNEESAMKWVRTRQDFIHADDADERERSSSEPSAAKDERKARLLALVDDAGTPRDKALKVYERLAAGADL